MRAKDNVTQADAGTSIAGSISVERVRIMCIYIYVVYIYICTYAVFCGGKEEDEDALGRFGKILTTPKS